MSPASQFSLSGRVALVTGSSGGIGEAIARGYAEAGAFVLVHGLDPVAGHRVAQDIGGAFVPGDLATEHGVRSLAHAVHSHARGLDVLVNNAGLEAGQTLDRLDLAVLDQVVAVNFRAPVQLSQLLLPLLQRSPSASVINVTSIHDTVPVHGNCAYAASKAALAMFTRTAAIEWGPRGVRVNALSPGAIETDMNRELLHDIGREAFAEWIPLGRVGAIKDVAGPALFLAADASRYMTGATLVVDGAYSQHLVRYRTDDVIEESP